jgi:hypothetical protein
MRTERSNASAALLLLLAVVMVAAMTAGDALRVFPSPGVPAPAHYDYCQANLEQSVLSAHLRNITQTGYELVQVQVLFRHGDRTPLGQIRKTPTYEDPNIWQCWADELNNYALEQPVGQVASELQVGLDYDGLSFVCECRHMCVCVCVTARVLSFLASVSSACAGL